MIYSNIVFRTTMCGNNYILKKRGLRPLFLLLSFEIKNKYILLT